MSPLQLLALYLGVGAIAAAVVARRQQGALPMRLASALVAWALWPLWAPIALAPAERHDPRAPIARRLHAVLDEALVAAESTALASLLSRDAAARIRADIDRAMTRIARLDDALGRPGFDLRAAESRVIELERSGATARAIATARLHRDGVARLEHARTQDHRALVELEGALEALRSQIVLAQVAGAAPDEVVSELWARVEGLGAALDVTEEGPSASVVDRERTEAEARA
ncbi:hypothetical protein [Sandaracinus amylolyticus]|uniref:hypothetical protein n=1 Tax=Sandaracinus amylolyticus TaxID=927083 RepID=UPI001F3A357A|nr:hypothetical protein [Sandaracinus amylolyticus]UJR81254.1 Hypothetical protein I5071_33100 [Sandaracinus amylolyticus]